MSVIDIRRGQAHRLRMLGEECLPDDKDRALKLLREARALDDETDLIAKKLGRHRRPSVIE